MKIELTAKFMKPFVFWLILNILVVAAMQVALFAQTTPDMKDASMAMKILVAEIAATFEWMLLIPMNRIASTFLTSPQISLSSFVFDFISQIWSNAFWLHVPTTIDDYACMSIILFGMYVSKMQLLD